MQGEAGARKHEFPCQSCGAKLVFTPGEDLLACTHCGRVQEIEKHDGRAVAEYSLEDARRAARTIPLAELSDHGIEVHCTGCGAVWVVDGQAASCPFCDSPVVVERSACGVLSPEGLLSFALDRRRAGELFSRWVARRWLAPSDLRARARAGRLDGVYLPHWSFSSHTKSTYTGLRGRSYRVEEQRSDASGRARRHTVQRIRWRPAFGTVWADFSDVLVCASRSLPAPLLRRLEPWDLGALRPYRPEYLSGFCAERYAIELEPGFAAARERMEAEIRHAVRRDIGGDAQLITSLRVHHRDVRVRHVLFPLWISSFRYGEKVYRFAVNARTGKISGERPWSRVKVALTVVAGFAVAAFLWWLRHRVDGP